MINNGNGNDLGSGCWNTSWGARFLLNANFFKIRQTLRPATTLKFNQLVVFKVVGAKTDRFSDRQTGSQTDRQILRPTDRLSERQTDCQNDKETLRPADRLLGRQTDRLTLSPTGRLLDRKIASQTDRLCFLYDTTNFMLLSKSLGKYRQILCHSYQSYFDRFPIPSGHIIVY